MKPVLAVLNVREIPEVLAALDALSIDKVLIRGYTERQIADSVWTEQVMPTVIERGYTHLTLISDDAVIPPHSLELVLRHAEQHPERVTTGWCNQDFTDDKVALSTEPLTDETPKPRSYTLPSWRDVLMGPEVQLTYFTGFCLTTCTVEMWERYPYQAYGDDGFAADYNMSRRLAADGVQIDALRDAFCLHLRETRNGSPGHPERRVLVGEMEPEVRFA
jgi:hypothetical protein